MTEMTRTEELLALADAAQSSTHPDEIDWYATDTLVNRGVAYIEDANFIAAANPETIKQLVELCRLQHEALKMYAERGYCDPYPSIAAFNKFEGGE